MRAAPLSAAFLLLPFISTAAAAWPWVHSSFNLTDADRHFDAMLILSDATPPEWPDAVVRASEDHAQRRTAVFNHLTQWTDRAQRRLRQSLARHHAPGGFVPFWIANVIAVHNISGAVLSSVHESSVHWHGCIQLLKFRCMHQ